MSGFPFSAMEPTGCCTSPRPPAVAEGRRLPRLRCRREGESLEISLVGGIGEKIAIHYIPSKLSSVLTKGVLMEEHCVANTFRDKVGGARDAADQSVGRGARIPRPSRPPRDERGLSPPYANITLKLWRRREALLFPLTPLRPSALDLCGRKATRRCVHNKNCALTETYRRSVSVALCSCVTCCEKPCEGAGNERKLEHHVLHVPLLQASLRLHAPAQASWGKCLSRRSSPGTFAELVKAKAKMVTGERVSAIFAKCTNSCGVSVRACLACGRTCGTRPCS